MTFSQKALCEARKGCQDELGWTKGPGRSWQGVCVPLSWWPEGWAGEAMRTDQSHGGGGWRDLSPKRWLGPDGRAGPQGACRRERGGLPLRDGAAGRWRPVGTSRRRLLQEGSPKARGSLALPSRNLWHFCPNRLRHRKWGHSPLHLHSSGCGSSRRLCLPL